MLIRTSTHHQNYHRLNHWQSIMGSNPTMDNTYQPYKIFQFSKIYNNLHHLHFDMFSIFFSVIASTEPNITLAYRASEEYNLPDLSPRSWHEFALRYRQTSNISHTKSQNLDVSRLKSPASRVFTQPFIQAQIKENIKAPRHWPFVWGIHRWPMNSPHKRPVTRKRFPFDDVIMC